MIDGWSNSGILDIRNFREADCDTDHYLDVAKVTGRLAVSKQAAQTLDVERLNLRKLSELEVRKQYRIKISNKLTALKILSDSENINRACETIQENIKTSAKESLGLYELKLHKPWFDENCLRILDKKKQVKMQWLQNPNQSRVYNLNTVKRETRRHFRKKEKEYLKA